MIFIRQLLNIKENSMEPYLICLDLDGTLLNDEKKSHLIQNKY